MSRIDRRFNPLVAKKWCAYCGSRLKKTGFLKWAPACRKCGRMQPWAEQQPSAS